jgi:hypothetical protein
MQPIGTAWRPEDPEQVIARTEDVYKPEILNTIETKIDDLADDLTRLSLDISGMQRFNVLSTFSSNADHPELRFEERYVVMVQRDPLNLE